MKRRGFLGLLAGLFGMPMGAKAAIKPQCACRLEGEYAGTIAGGVTFIESESDFARRYRDVFETVDFNVQREYSHALKHILEERE